MKRRTLLMVAVTTAAASVGILYAWSFGARFLSDRPVGILEPVVEKPSIATEALVTTEPTDERPTTVTSKVDMVEVRRQCADRLPEWTDECRRTLDTYFLPQPPPDYDRIKGLMPVTYAEIFGNVGDRREAVRAALADSECSVDEDSIRPDLYERCSAEALALYARFIIECRRAKTWMVMEHVNDFDYRRSIRDQLASVHESDYGSQEDYVAALDETVEDFYQTGWLMTTCRPLIAQHGPPVTVSERDSLISKGIRSRGMPTEAEIEARRDLYQRRYGSGHPWLVTHSPAAFEGAERRKLIHLAARLGHEWSQFRSHKGTPGYLDALKRVNPLAFHFQQMWDQRQGSEAQKRNEMIVERLASAQGRTVDRNLLSNYATTRALTPEEEQQAISEGLAEYERLYGDQQPQ